MYRLLFHGLCLTAAINAQALTLDSLSSECVSKNPEIAFYEAQIQIAQGRRIEAGKKSNPTLTAQIGTWDVKGVGDGPAWQAAVSQTFEWPGRISLRKAIADRQIALAELGLQSLKASLSAKARGVGMQFLVQQEKLDATQAALSRLKGVLNVLVQRDPAGVAPLLEMRILEAQVLAFNKAIADATKEKERIKLELNFLRGAAPEADLHLTASNLELPALPSLDSLLTLAQKQNFDIRARQAEVQQQGFEVELARNERGPSVTVQPFVARQQAGPEREINAGISVSIPLPLWNRNQGNIAAAEARRVQLETSLLVTSRSIDRQVVEHSKFYNTLRAQLNDTAPEALNLFHDAAEQGDRHYQLGAIPVSTYLELQKSYLDALETLLSSKAEALLELQEIELLTNACLLKP
ncbi:MAG: TolC family protein [Verrucomicrobiaceae bacterium]|nr:TolC family protein [Verrucomicrobiaceae bacterium]